MRRRSAADPAFKTNRRAPEQAAARVQGAAQASQGGQSADRVDAVVVVFQAGAGEDADPGAVAHDQVGDPRDHVAVDAAFGLHPLRGEGRSVAGDFFEPDRMLFDQLLVVVFGFDEVPDQPPAEGAVGARIRLGENVGVAGDGVEARVDDHQLGAPAPGIGELAHEGGVAHGRVGAEEKNEVRLGKFRKGVPEADHQAVAEKAPVETGRVVGKVVGRPEGVGETPGVAFLLVKADSLALPDAHRPGAILGSDAAQPGGDLGHGLLPGDGLEPASRHPLEGTDDPVGVVKLVDGGPAPRAHAALVDGVPLEGGDVHDHPVLEVDVDRAARVAHAAKGRDHPVIDDGTGFHGIMVFPQRRRGHCSTPHAPSSTHYRSWAVPGLLDSLASTRIRLIAPSSLMSP